MRRVESAKEKRPKGLILKTLERCRSLGSHRKRQMAPEGCFSVYVGAARERFMVRTECLNHPLFRMLLDEAEMEFGFPAAGPLELPCDVELFQNVLLQVEQDAAELQSTPRCNFSKSTHAAAGYLLMSPARPMIMTRVQ
ncbi:auxin-responsive protein SAUR71-like [Canna indica]|uniref:Auxin-responsive protein SAUR71-like n=1 Tax=Canna indica TaxID=4628 RepID=A0AAQ3JRF0_9LILI|nr:auxin-responsive protein SAUR71-like [Canna indica]